MQVPPRYGLSIAGELGISQSCLEHPTTSKSCEVVQSSHRPTWSYAIQEKMDTDNKKHTKELYNGLSLVQCRSLTTLSLQFKHDVEGSVNRDSE